MTSYIYERLSRPLVGGRRGCGDVLKQEGAKDVAVVFRLKNSALGLESFDIMKTSYGLALKPEETLRICTFTVPG